MDESINLLLMENDEIVKLKMNDDQDQKFLKQIISTISILKKNINVLKEKNICITNEISYILEKNEIKNNIIKNIVIK